MPSITPHSKKFKKPLIDGSFLNRMKSSKAMRKVRNTRYRPEKTRRADSESEFLATKLFSWIFAFEAIGARIGVHFGTSFRRFANRDLDLAHVIGHENGAARMPRDAVLDRALRIQMPSLLLRRSLTACGLTLPPDDFIT